MSSETVIRTVRKPMMRFLLAALALVAILSAPALIKSSPAAHPPAGAVHSEAR